ncbi:MAG TPA: hypothetical protein VF538_16820 [Pyrinomonadaceae bacterium]|jgi:hypothetical protein
MRTLFDLFDEAGRGPSEEAPASAGEPFAEEIMAEVRGAAPAAGRGEVPPVVTRWSDKCLSLLGSDERSFCSQLFALLKEIPDLADQTLENFMSSVSMAERRLFLLRGACASERIERVAERVPGELVVAKKKQTRKTGKTKLIAEMAGAIGVSAKLLARDVQIVSTFFPEGRPILARENLLAREYYVTALAAPDPIAALGTAVERGAPAGFSRAEFRDHVRGLKEALRPVRLRPVRMGKRRRPGVKIPPAARETLAKLVDATGRSEEEIVAEALADLWHSRYEPSDCEYDELPF